MTSYHDSGSTWTAANAKRAATLSADNFTSATTYLIGVPICPDLLTIEKIGEADTLHGRIVRGFFTVLSWLEH